MPDAPKNGTGRKLLWAGFVVLVTIVTSVGAYLACTALAAQGDLATHTAQIKALSVEHDKDIGRIEKRLEGMDQKLDRLLNRPEK